MMRQWGALAVMALGLASGGKLEAAETLTGKMSIAEVEAALPVYPPSAENVGPREMIAQSMDKLVHLTVKQDISDDEVAELAPLRDFYLRQVERGLQELEKCEVTEGVRIFKFYSSSVVVKSQDGVVAIDFQQGPRLTACSNPERPDPVVTRTGFHWSPEQLDRLAKIVDVSLITHAHADHADYELSKRLTEQGKTVVVPQQLKNFWSSLGEHLVVPAYGTAQKFGPVEIFTTVGAQYMENDATTTDVNGTVIGYPSKNPAVEDAETVVYLAKVGNLTFLQAAENNVPVDQWLRDAATKGFRPDIKMSQGARQGARSVSDAMKDIGPVFFLPIHEYEMGHEGGGNRTAGYYEGRRKVMEKGMMMALFWGENFAMKPAMLSWRAGDTASKVTQK